MIDRDSRRTLIIRGGASYIYSSNSGAASGIALNAPQQQVHLMDESTIKTYSFSDIRSWRRNEIEFEKAVGYGLVPGMVAAGENARAKNRAEQGSGLFISVRDIEKPEWRIAMPIEEQKKWFEILTQLLNEGRLSAQ